MKWVYIVCLAFSSLAQATMKYHFRDSQGHGAEWEQVEVKLPADQLQGTCMTVTEDMIPVSVPCREVEVEVQSDVKRNIASTKTDPRGRFQFSGLKPAEYTIVFRPKNSKDHFFVNGVKTGGDYTIQMVPPKDAPKAR